MGGKLGKAQNTYVVSGGQAGGSRVSGAMEEYLEDRRHGEPDLNYSGGALRPKLLFKRGQPRSHLHNLIIFRRAGLQQLLVQKKIRVR